MFFSFKKKGKKKKSDSVNLKNGVRRIQSDEEIFAAFTDDDTPSVLLEEPPPVGLRIQRLDEEECEKVSGNVQRGKHGIPVLDKSDDLSSMIQDSVSAMQDKDEAGNIPRKQLQQNKSLKTKHGIPILDKGEDFLSAFKDRAVDDRFEEILSESLGEKTQEVLLQEKTDKIGPIKQITAKERLSRYPLPQGQIDLHGYSAIRADLKAESYIKNAFYNGTYTIRIIVGKGLHSQDGPVLPDVIEKRVIQLKNEEIIFAYEWDKKKKSKSGSITVFLNNYYLPAGS